MTADLPERCGALARLAVELADVPAVSGHPDLAGQLIAMAGRLRAVNFNVAVLGEFKRGKSSLINALVGEAVLPVGVVPLTSVITQIHHGPALKIDVHLADGTAHEVSADELPDYATEVGNPDNVKGVRRIDIALPAKLLVEGVRIIDTPGVGSAYAHNTATTEGFLGEIDAGIFVLAADQPASQSELDFLRDVAAYLPKILFILNKADRLSASELEESQAFTRRTLAAMLPGDIQLFPTSATQGLEASRRGDAQLRANSGLQQVEDALRQLMTAERRSVLAETALRAITRVGDHVSALLGIEKKALQLDEAARHAAKAKLETLVQQVEDERSRVDLRLRIDIEQRVRQKLLDEIAALPGSVLPTLHQGLDAQEAVIRQAPARQRETLLDDWLRDQVRHTFDAWRPAEEETLLGEIRAIAGRYADDINALLSRAWEQVATVLETNPPKMEAPALALQETNFRLKTHEDVEILLDIGYRWLRQALPASIAVPILLRRSRKRLESLIDRHCGRLRYALQSQIDATGRSIRQTLGQDLDRLVVSIRQTMLETTPLQGTGAPLRLHEIDRQMAAIRNIQKQATLPTDHVA